MIRFITLFDYIKVFYNSILYILGLNPADTHHLINIYIKTNTGNTIEINLDEEWDIKNVKEFVASELGLKAGNMKIIFAGKELADFIRISECDLGEKTVLHAVSCATNRDDVTNSSRKSASVENTANVSGVSINPTQEFTQYSTEQHQFYIYCSMCKSITRGKLRVQCSFCKSGIFTVDRDPQNWDDILTPNQITGRCEDGLESCSPEPHFTLFYFKCSNHHETNDGALPLNLIRMNSRKIPCLACGDIRNPVLVFTCQERHVTCLDCFRDYCVSKLNDRQFLYTIEHGYTLSCPANCPNSLILETHHFHVMDETNYDKYQRFATEEFVLNAGGILCPSPNCGMGILCDSSCRKVTCSIGCKNVFCKYCLNDYHEGRCVTIENDMEISGPSNLNLRLNPKYIQNARWNEASRKTIMLTTKLCPNCKTPTERDGGCMHMVCSRAGCNFQWCWVCETAWNRNCMGSHWFG